MPSTRGGGRVTGVESRVVSWWSVHEFVEPYVDVGGRFPLVGTAAWRALPDDHQQKWAALLDAAQHHALRVETAQQARAEASRDIAASADWPAISRELLQLDSFRRMNPWSRRKAVRHD